MIHSGRPARLFEDVLRRVIGPAERILDVGTSRRFAKELAPHRALFDGKEYIATGYHPASHYGDDNCDAHQDAEHLTYADATFDAALCIEVIEHVQHPQAVVDELHRVLRPGGRVLLTTPATTGYHGKNTTASTLDALRTINNSHETYPDFWRFTHEGLLYLFRQFAFAEVYPVDGPLEMRLKLLRGEPWIHRAPLRGLLDRFDRPRVGGATSRHILYAER